MAMRILAKNFLEMNQMGLLHEVLLLKRDKIKREESKIKFYELKVNDDEKKKNGKIYGKLVGIKKLK